MTKRLATMLLAAMLLIGSASSYVHGQDLGTPTLKGIGAVYVLLGDLDNGAKKLGLTKEAIQTDVELKLRLAGISIVTPEEASKLPGVPLLLVNAMLTDNASAVSLDVALCQNARLERNGDLALSVVT